MKKIQNLYIATLFLGAILPINGTHSALNNNYILSIRWDYILHALVYIPLFPLMVSSARSTEVRLQNNPNEKEVSGANQSSGFRWIVLALFLGFALEAMQYIIPWRTFNVNDLMSNLLGVGAGVLIWRTLKNRF